MMKKSQMLKFLFWTIIAIVFLLPACTLGSNLLKFGDNSEKSYSTLIEIIENTATRPVASTAVSMNKKSVIVGFSAGRNFENYHVDDGLKSVFNRPGECGSGTCICLCKGYKLDKDPNPDREPCEDGIICNTIDDIKLASEKIVGKDSKYIWKGGFLIHRDISDSERVNGLEKNNIPTRTFYVQRVGDVVGVCLERPSTEKPCVT